MLITFLLAVQEMPVQLIDFVLFVDVLELAQEVLVVLFVLIFPYSQLLKCCIVGRHVAQ